MSNDNTGQLVLRQRRLRLRTEVEVEVEVEVVEVSWDEDLAGVGLLS